MIGETYGVHRPVFHCVPFCYTPVSLNEVDSPNTDLPATPGEDSVISLKDGYSELNFNVFR